MKKLFNIVEIHGRIYMNQFNQERKHSMKYGLFLCTVFAAQLLLACPSEDGGCCSCKQKPEQEQNENFAQ